VDVPAPDPVVAADPVGAVVETALTAHGLGTATYDAGRRYRYRLSRLWEPALSRCCFVMLNPSTADAATPDPTLRRCVRFARAWGHGAVELVNVCALRSTDPTTLRDADDPVGPDNDRALLAATRAADVVVAGWGACAAAGDRADVVRRLLGDAGTQLSALRLTRDGAPGHPLYVRSDAVPVPYARPARLCTARLRPPRRCRSRLEDFEA
jgi:hypothetical protein